jgi:hypothetical protein
MLRQDLLLESGDETVGERRGIPVVRSAGIPLLESRVRRTRILLAFESNFAQSLGDLLRAKVLSTVDCGVLSETTRVFFLFGISPGCFTFAAAERITSLNFSLWWWWTFSVTNFRPCICSPSGSQNSVSCPPRSVEQCARPSSSSRASTSMPMCSRIRRTRKVWENRPTLNGLPAIFLK